MTMILAATLLLAMLKDDDITMVNNDKDNEIDYGIIMVIYSSIWETHKVIEKE